jgi:hypothetical protein
LVCGATEPSRVLVAWEHGSGAYSIMRARMVVATLTHEASPPTNVRLFFREAQMGERGSAEEAADLARLVLASMA